MTKRWINLFFYFSVLNTAACAQLAPVPHDEGQWSKLKAIYDYRAKAVDVKETPVEDASQRVETIAYSGPEGDAVKGFFFRPKEEGVYPVVLLLHGLGDSAKGGMVTGVAKLLTDKGLAVLALDAPHHGDRASQEDKQLFFKTFLAVGNSKVKGDLTAQIRDVDKDGKVEALLAETVRQGVKDYRTAMDWLSARKDVNHDRIGAIGYSLGSIMSSILAGVDGRVHSIGLCVGGDPSAAYLADAKGDTQTHALTTACSLYIEHAAGRPLLMLNGKNDQIIPKSATDRLFNAAKDPKEIRWYESGHALPSQAIHDVVAWTIEELKGK